MTSHAEAQTVTRSVRLHLPFSLSMLSMLAVLALLASCDSSKNPTAAAGPLNDGSGKRTQIVIISDMHLGADLAYAECNQNRGALVEFLNEVAESPTVRELVIAGDLLDEWFVPATTATYAGKDQADFVDRIASANPEVFGAFNRVIEEGRILVTYVPGNHDLTITAENVDRILPGIQQSRDEVLGLGTRSPVDHPEIAIEHGHRYNFFCAPDPLSNATVAPGSILPPGYFFTRIATLHVLQGCETAGGTLAEVTPNAAGDASQELAYAYWAIWRGLMQSLPVENTFDEKIIVTNINGFTETYAINDLVPFQETPGGFIDMNLYNGSLDNWDERQTANHVPVHIPTMQALTEAASDTGTDDQAPLQYFSNPDSEVRIVVFGHTHVARIVPGENHAGQKTIYVNSGTWIDRNPNGSTMNFVVITPQGSDADSQTAVKLYRANDGVMEVLAADSVRL
jgi:UDP-2,3-diacylglucosamine pyrophosphatase LpxH